ncbi:MAG: hypothetical protein WBA15_03190 [Mesorhizobium sp.]
MAEARHPETRDVWPRALLWFAGGLVGFLFVTLGVLYLLFRPQALWTPPGAEWSDNEANPALSTSPHEDLAAIRRQEDAELEKLAWVDRDKGIARIPIEDAMRLIAQNRLPNLSNDAAPALPGECDLLGTDVPRAPQARNCRDDGGGNP